MSTTPFPLPIMLDAADRKALRARAHHLDPVIMIGESGLTRAVLDETDRALRAHELIKVRVLGDDRAQRQAMSTEICSALGCTAVQSIGKLLVLYRPRPIEDHARGDEPHVPKKRAAQGDGRAKRPSARNGKAPKRPTGGTTGARNPTKAAAAAPRGAAKAGAPGAAARSATKRPAERQRPGNSSEAGARTAAKRPVDARTAKPSAGARPTKPASGARSTKSASGARATKRPSRASAAKNRSAPRSMTQRSTTARPAAKRAGPAKGAGAAKRAATARRQPARAGGPASARPAGRTKKG